MKIEKIFFGMILLLLALTVNARELKKKPELDQRTTVSGSVFTRDNKYPRLGEAYRDPSGLIWGEPFEPSRYNPGTCQQLGFRGPTVAEFVNLASYLGEGSPRGYSPKTSDGRSDVLPFLSGSCYFPYGSKNFIGHDEQIVFCGDTGQISIYGSRLVNENALNVICVAR